MTSSYYSHGKLLLTSEYLVVDGAEGIAIPCKKGQELRIQSTDSTHLYWRSFDVNKSIWFEAKYQQIFDNTGGKRESRINEIESSDPQTSKFLLHLLNVSLNLNPTLSINGIHAESFLEFDRSWGLGSSSTIISNISKWLKVDPYKLFFKTQNGSGYDIACATESAPIVYKTSNSLVNVKKSLFYPEFKDQIYFVHLGKKQNSSAEVHNYSSLTFDRSLAIETIEKISKKVECAETIEEFEKLLDEHECEMSKILKRSTIKDTLFADYKGSVKSLGAWGGDFILVTKRPNFVDYFSSLGYTTIISFDDMVL